MRLASQWWATREFFAGQEAAAWDGIADEDKPLAAFCQFVRYDLAPSAIGPLLVYQLDEYWNSQPSNLSSATVIWLMVFSKSSM